MCFIDFENPWGCQGASSSSAGEQDSEQKIETLLAGKSLYMKCSASV